MNDLTISNQFPAERFNNLVPMQTVTDIAEIHKPVINTVKISTDLKDKEIYKEGDGWALTKKGLGKLMRAAGIKILYTKAELPGTCQRCADVNRNIGQPVRCYACPCKDVKYSCMISVPQLTGEPMTYEASREIIVEDETANMKPAQKANFLKFRNEHCESKALNRALRGALNIKPTYTKEELEKPFVVAYLIPNLDNPDVKQAAVSKLFGASDSIFGMAPEIEDRTAPAIEAASAPAIEAQPVEAAVIEERPEPQSAPTAPANTATAAPYDMASGELHCDECDEAISDRVYEYSLNKFGRPLCMKCQKGVH